MKLRLAQVEHVASRVRLALTEHEVELFREQLSSILDYAERLHDLDTDAVPVMATVLPLETGLRDDRVQSSLPLEDVLSSAPAVEQNCFRVPTVFGGEV
jgi:aspartyl-tRNA(Asn)/glutamyl-tRNA(Gln) amidotransferase subunit C